MIPLWFAVGLGWVYKSFNYLKFSKLNKIEFFFLINYRSYGIHFTVQSVSNEMSIFAVAAIKEVIILTMIVCLIPIYKKVSN